MIFFFQRLITSIISDRFSVNKFFCGFLLFIFILLLFSKFMLAVTGLCLTAARALFLVEPAGAALHCSVGFLLWSTGSWDMGLVVASRGLYSVGLVFVAHGVSCSPASGIFLDRDRTHVSCICRWIPIHCTNREVLWTGVICHLFSMFNVC